jgi:oxygen-independent coproporphyrinogen-3 oxidase
LYEAVGRELELRAELLDAAFGAPDTDGRPPLASVYFGGGTPSLVPGEWLERLLAIVRTRFGLAPDAEITLEANPGPEDRGDLATFRRLGVNRISFGAQSLDRVELRRLGRRHSPEDVAAAVAEARAAGIGSVNLDLLYDLPGQSLQSWEATLGAALRLAPDHLSLYALTLDDPDAEGLTREAGDHLPTAPGARSWRERARVEQDDDRAAEQYQLASELLGAGGWRGYEISNWCRPGHESRHNLVYWERRPYHAVGPGAPLAAARIRLFAAGRRGAIDQRDRGRGAGHPGTAVGSRGTGELGRGAASGGRAGLGRILGLDGARGAGRPAPPVPYPAWSPPQQRVVPAVGLAAGRQCAPCATGRRPPARAGHGRPVPLTAPRETATIGAAS